MWGWKADSSQRWSCSCLRGRHPSRAWDRDRLEGSRAAQTLSRGWLGPGNGFRPSCLLTNTGVKMYTGLSFREETRLCDRRVWRGQNRQEKQLPWWGGERALLLPSKIHAWADRTRPSPQLSLPQTRSAATPQSAETSAGHCFGVGRQTGCPLRSGLREAEAEGSWQM